MKFIIFLVHLLFFNVCVDQSKATKLAPVVKTENGLVQGVIEHTPMQNKTYYAYYSIPYGKAERFKPPVKADSWKGIRDATKPGEVCIQFNRAFRKIIGKENCQELHVYTPKLTNKPNELAPVMVWIHGGAFVIGSGHPDTYGPGSLLTRNVVLVCINYRLGPMGFLATPHPDASGNAGLYDQVQALKWVKNNIRNFGGNPDQVTIFGESAGAASVSLLTVSKLSKGYYNRAISQSGVELCEWAVINPELAHKIAFTLGKSLGYLGTDVDDLVKFLKEVDAKKMIEVATLVTPVHFWPTLQHKIPEKSAFLSKYPSDIIKSGEHQKLTRMHGYMHDEGVTFVGFLLSEVANATDIPEVLGAANAALLPLSEISLNISDKALRKVTKMITDRFFAAPTNLLQKKLVHNNDGHNIYSYVVSLKSDYYLHKRFYNVDGAGHEDDIPFLFDTLYAYTSSDMHTIEGKTRNAMLNMWTNFAKFGNPTPNPSTDTYAGVQWKPYSEDGAMLDIGEKLTLKYQIPDKDPMIMIHETSLNEKYFNPLLQESLSSLHVPEVNL